MKSYKNEFESLRHNVSASQFYYYCKAQALKKGLNPEWYLEYEDWKTPIQPCDYHINKHEDWDEPKTEVIKHISFDAQFYLEGSYNFIMEYDADERIGYCYIAEN